MKNEKITEGQIIGTATIINNSIIQGWFFSKKEINIPLKLEIYINNNKITNIVANKFRPDIVEKKIHPTGMIGFNYKYNINENDDIFLYFPEYDYKFYLQKRKSNSFQNININKNKKKLCIVHIGMHKTGSSSIQYNLNKYKFNNFSYFNLGVDNHSIPIFSLFTKHPEKYHIHLRAGRNKKEIEEYNNEIKKMFINHLQKNKDKEVFIISGEDISALNNEEVTAFRNFLYKYFEKIKIIGYIRSPHSFISSNFQESVKAGLYNFNIDIHYPHYRNRIEKFDMIFGRENVDLIYFNQKNLKNKDVVIDFLYRLQLYNDDYKNIKFEKINTSLSLETTSVLYFFNKFLKNKNFTIVEKEKIRMNLLSKIKNLGNKKFLLDMELIKKVIQKYKDDVDWIEKRMNVNLSKQENLNYSIGIKSENDMLFIAKKTLDILNKIDFNDANLFSQFQKFIIDEYKKL
ncbi:hypothetical protein FE773_05785 [Caminibacter mediatlanticus TB-2]|uniref:Uncharacterized protein n=1 Tax=Caminibacter mediatlanticus TB-2 TaxID=391592 RepID=A0ABX5V8T4_9BACT|nr:hypothetical protein [Caminibacter mediatlanticus]QCT94705.1 hypothetical protein FE773_05785 [Caminibacter mediatlanticus TB-2]